MGFSRIEWCDYSLNILTGCQHGCPYCYARNMSQRFSGNVRKNLTETKKYRKEGEIYVLDEPFLDESGQQIMYPFGFAPTFHKYRLGCLDELKMGRRVFVGAMTDLFGEWVPERIIMEVFSECANHPKNKYIFLTKNPQRYAEINLPDEDTYFYGTSVTSPDDFYRLGFLPKAGKRFVSFEPLLADISAPLRASIENNREVQDLDWIIVGAETGRKKGKTVPEPEWVSSIVEYADHWNVPVFMKDSLIKVVGEDNMRCDSPEIILERPMGDRLSAKRTCACWECGKKFRKKMMITVSARAKERGRSTRLCYICGSCFGKWCEKNGFKDPELEGEE